MYRSWGEKYSYNEKGACVRNLFIKFMFLNVLYSF